jgi:DNA-binding MarR family transcriptional regulator
VVLSAIQRRTLRAFLRTVALAEPVQRELASSHGVSLGDLYAVRVLARLGEVPVSRYGGELGLARSTITNLVDRLERAGLVARVAGPGDRRVTLVRLTAAGQDAMEARARFAESDVARRLLALEEADQVALAEILERLLAIPAPSGKRSAHAAASRQSSRPQQLRPGFCSGR